MKLTQKLLNRLTELREKLIGDVEDWGDVKEITYEFNDDLPEDGVLVTIDFGHASVELEFGLDHPDYGTVLFYGEDVYNPATAMVIWRGIAHGLLDYIREA